MAFLAQIQNFNKKNLKDVETRVTTTTVVERKSSSFRWHFGHDDEEETIEWFDDPKLFRQHCKELAHKIKSAKNIVVYTGAGISTSASVCALPAKLTTQLPDYRGSDGMWTHRDAGTNQDKSKYVATISSALPTLAHMAISELCSRGIVKSVVSTNVDGLHMRSGVPSEILSELHGNSYLEICEKCGERYLHPTDVLQNQTAEHRLVNRHWCGDICTKPGCDGLLLDTIVAFGENLPEDQLAQAIQHSQEGDLALVLGTTMMVQPACLLPEYIYKKKKGEMVICNLQNTQYDKHATLRLHGRTDDVMYLVMKELKIDIPTTLPDGHKIRTYIDDIDEFYTKRNIENNKKLEEIRKEKAEKPYGNSNALTRGENIYHRTIISGKEDTKDLHFDTIQLAFFNHCNSTSYNVKSKTKKIVVEDCHNLNLAIDEKVITGTLELINCNNLHIIVNVPVLTITCDNVKGVTITFKNRDCLQLIAWAQTTDNEVFIGPEAVNIDTEEVDFDKDQIITQKLESGVITSRITRRDRCGRITGLI